jgi:hypothetical protein
MRNVVAFAQVDAGGVEQLTPAHASPLLPLEPDEPLDPSSGPGPPSVFCATVSSPSPQATKAAHVRVNVARRKQDRFKALSMVWVGAGVPAPRAICHK